MHKFMNELCLNCNKFSHCNNNDLICISKYKVKEQECEELTQRLEEVKQELQEVKEELWER